MFCTAICVVLSYVTNEAYNLWFSILPDCVFSGNVQNLGDMLCTVTGFGSFSLQPNVGAAGEYAGLMVIRAYYMV